MQIQRRQQCNSAVLALSGEIDVYQRDALGREARDLIESGVRRLVVNMRRVRFINTSGIGALLEIHRMLERLGGQLVISQPAESVWQPIELLGLDRLLTVRHRRNLQNQPLSPLRPAWKCDANLAPV